MFDNIFLLIATKVSMLDMDPAGSVINCSPGSRSVIQDYRSKDPDLDQKEIFTDSQLCNITFPVVTTNKCCETELAWICIILTQSIQDSLWHHTIISSVADPDTYVFRPPGSRSISQRYGSGSSSRSFCHQAKIFRKTLIPTVLWLLFWHFIFQKCCKCTLKKY